MGVTITLGVRASGGQVTETLLPNEPRESGTEFADLLSGREFDSGSWSSGTGFAARERFEPRPAAPTDESSYVAREREEVEREVERRDPASSTAAPATASGPVEPGPREEPRVPARDSDASGGESSRRPARSTEAAAAERTAVRPDRDRSAAARPESSAQDDEVDADAPSRPENAPVREKVADSGNATATSKALGSATGPTPVAAPDAGDASAESGEAAPAEPAVEASSEAPGEVDLSGLDANAAEATEGAGAAGGTKTTAEEAAPAEPDSSKVAAAEDAESARSEPATATDFAEASEEGLPTEGELLAPRPAATAAPVLRASEIARAGETRPETGLAQANGVATSTTAGDVSFRVVETAASADVGGGGNGSGGSGSAGQGDGSAAARASLAVSGAGGAQAASAKGAFPPASVFPEGGDTAPSWAERIAERVRLARSGDRIELRLALMPKGLGQIDVRLRLDGEGLHATIVAEHEQTRALLAGQQHRLESVLAQEDLNLSSFDLGVDDGGADEEASRGERREGGQGALHDDRSAEPDEPDVPTNITSTLPGRLSFWA